MSTTGSISRVCCRCRPLGLCPLAGPHPCQASLPPVAPLPVGVHRGRQQGVCGGVHLARHPVQRTVRGPLPPGHLSGQALHRPQTSGDCAAGGSQVCVSWRHRKGEATGGRCWGGQGSGGGGRGTVKGTQAAGEQVHVLPPGESGAQGTDCR